ncbi:NUMOD4 motif-containing HNH endonuclease [Mycolicibacterium fortuitum]|uniref:NUMOD4 motif-containing HNH endonuclease n=1 Tax=Mycolicibacterium fortuitum TaxID=1766 RepID=UPI000942E0B4
MDATQEQWRPVVGYEGAYEVSDQGRVRSLDRTIVEHSGKSRRLRGRVLTLMQNGHRDNRPQVSLGFGVHRMVHHLVAESFLGPRPGGVDICHNNGDPTDNRLENLRYDTRSGNNLDQVAHGTHPHASKTRCPAGHEYNTENSSYRTRKDGGPHRICLICKRENARTSRARGATW